MKKLAAFARCRVRLLCLITALILCTAGCSAFVPINRDSAESQESEDYSGYVNLLVPISAAPEKIVDLQLITDRINKITSEKIGVTVEIIPSSSDTAKLLKKEGLEFDLSYNMSLHSTSSMTPLDELLKSYGRDILNAFTDEELSWGKVDGVQYLIPTKRDYASSSGIAMRKDILDKYEIDPDSIKSVWDLDRLYDFLSTREPELKLTAPETTGINYLTRILLWETVISGVSVMRTAPETVVSTYDTPEYESLVRLFRKWYQKGYMLDEMRTVSLNSSAFVRTNELFSYFCVYKPGINTETSIDSNCEMVAVPLSEPFLTNSSVSRMQWGISAGCKHPVEAMKLLNLLYSDPDIMNLLCYGVEGIHYVVLPDGTIDYPEGVDAQNSGYCPNLGWTLPNQFIAHVFKGNSLDLWERLDQFNKNTARAHTYGFRFDSSGMTGIVRSVADVAGKYNNGLATGMLDPDVYLPLMRQELHDAGIDALVSEVQRQYDEWRSEQQ